MNISIIVGARPNFPKISGIIKEMDKYDDISYEIVHTGQHYDKYMSEILLKELDIVPSVNLSVGHGHRTHGTQTAKTIKDVEKYCFLRKPDIVIVVGDVNSTLGASIAVSKIPSIKLAHIESGIRRNLIDTPEEVNRRVTDVLSDFLFCTDKTSHDNLRRENIPKEKIYIVGNTMIDNLHRNIKKIGKVKKENLVLVTMHRPYNVDYKKRFERILISLNKISEKTKVFFPIHPRAAKNADLFDLKGKLENLHIINPLSGLNFLKIMLKSKCVITDSGGVQTETTALNIPCITVNNYTVHQNTIEDGTNILIDDIEELTPTVTDILNGNRKWKKDGYLWDGKASERIVKILWEKYNEK